MGDKRMKYLDMLQSVTSRMAGDQVTLRTWSVGLGTAVIGYAAAKDQHLQAALLAVLPASVFWILDAYYLALERGFRTIFNAERVLQDDSPSFNFDISNHSEEWVKALGSPAVWLVHCPVLLLALSVGIYGVLHAKP